jgi:hypothetical protein
MGAGSLILNLPAVFPVAFLAFFLGSWVGSGFPLASLSLEGAGTSFDGRVTC